MSERFELRVEVEFCRKETDDNDLVGRNVFRVRTLVDAGGTASNGSIGLGCERAMIGETAASVDVSLLVLVILSDDDEVDEDRDVLEEDGVGDLSLRACPSIPEDPEPEADGSSRSASNLTLVLETIEGAVTILLGPDASPVFILPFKGLGCSSPIARPARLSRLEAGSLSWTSSSSPSSITGDPGGRNPSCSPECVDGGGPKPSGFEYVPLELL